MIQVGAALPSEKFAEQARGFVRDFAAYAGGDGIWAGRQRAVSRLAATIISRLIGALIAFVGLTALDTPPAVLITAHLIFARISAPAFADVAQFAAPADPAIRAIGRRLSAG